MRNSSLRWEKIRGKGDRWGNGSLKRLREGDACSEENGERSLARKRDGEVYRGEGADVRSLSRGNRLV